MFVNIIDLTLVPGVKLILTVFFSFILHHMQYSTFLLVERCLHIPLDRSRGHKLHSVWWETPLHAAVYGS